MNLEFGQRMAEIGELLLDIIVILGVAWIATAFVFVVELNLGKLYRTLTK